MAVNKYWILRKKYIRSIKRVDKNVILNECNEIRLFAVMRNEGLRLPYFLNYYQDLGIDRLFLVDNSSDDNSLQIAQSATNVHLFQTTDSYQEHWYWIEHLLEQYGKGHWCMVVDIDELFAFPYSNHLSIRDLCNFLDTKQQTALRSLLLDMYANADIRDVVCSPSKSPLDVLTYFDTYFQEKSFLFSNRITQRLYRTSIFTGGLRDRVFGVTQPPAILSKVSLFKNIAGSYLSQGMHALDGGILSDIQGVVFHTKFLSDFLHEVEEECSRGQHFGNAFYYKTYKNRMEKTPNLNFHYENSVKYEDLSQLVVLGLMKSTTDFDLFSTHKISELYTL